MIRRPPRSTLSSSSAASDVYKRQEVRLLGSPGLKSSSVFRVTVRGGHAMHVLLLAAGRSDARRRLPLARGPVAWHLGRVPIAGGSADRGQRAPLGCGQDKFQGNAMTAAAEIQRAAVLGSVVLLPATALAAGWWRNEP